LSSTEFDYNKQVNREQAWVLFQFSVQVNGATCTSQGYNEVSTGSDRVTVLAISIVAWVDPALPLPVLTP